MFRVPRSADHPTFDDAEKIGFGRWLTSSAVDRREWMRRRNAAAQLAAANQRARATERYRPPEPRVRQTAQPVTASQPAPVDPTMRTLNRLARVELWLASIQLAALLIPVVIVLVIAAVVVWLLVA